MDTPRLQRGHQRAARSDERGPALESDRGSPHAHMAVTSMLFGHTASRLTSHTSGSGLVTPRRWWRTTSCSAYSRPPGRRSIRGIARTTAGGAVLVVRNAAYHHDVMTSSRTMVPAGPVLRPVRWRLSTCGTTHVLHAVTLDVWTLSAYAAGDCSRHQHSDHNLSDNERQ